MGLVGGWAAVKEADYFGGEDWVLPGLEDEWFWQLFQVSSGLKVGFSLERRRKYSARSSYSELEA